MTSESTYGLIVLDLMLPKMNGWRVCEELRARRNRDAILMLTARDAVEDRVRGLDAGAYECRRNPSILKAAIFHWFGRNYAGNVSIVPGSFG